MPEIHPCRIESERNYEDFELTPHMVLTDKETETHVADTLCSRAAQHSLSCTAPQCPLLIHISGHTTVSSLSH